MRRKHSPRLHALKQFIFGLVCALTLGNVALLSYVFNAVLGQTRSARYDLEAFTGAWAWTFAALKTVITGGDK